jgi:hypothetical protein
MLASDFLDPDFPVKLRNAFDLANIMDGMVPTKNNKNIGKTQFYFIDACRNIIDEMKDLINTDTPRIFEPELNIEDDRMVPVFHATIPGGIAMGEAGKPTQFAEGLIWALDHGCEDECEIAKLESAAWPVTAQSMKAALLLKASNSCGVLATGKIGNPILCFSRTPPVIDVAVRIIPPAQRDLVSSVRLTDFDKVEKYVFSRAPGQELISGQAEVGTYLFVGGAAPNEVRSKPQTLTVGFRLPFEFRIGGQP